MHVFVSFCRARKRAHQKTSTVDNEAEDLVGVESQASRDFRARKIARMKYTADPLQIGAFGNQLLRCFEEPAGAIDFYLPERE